MLEKGSCGDAVVVHLFMQHPRSAKNGRVLISRKLSSDLTGLGWKGP